MRTRTNKESIAVGSYFLDNKSSQLIYANGRVYRDVGLYLKPPVYEIPYSTLVPKTGPRNLLVSVNISTSPTAYGSVRMEPQYMEIGQAAGMAAALAIKNEKFVDQVNVKMLRKKLWKVGLTTSITVLCRRLPANQRAAWHFNPGNCHS